ncbi:hypothetical protein F5X98DRAFT_183443 [Xylaria grammica]|nr:hypothetical protein F5X98DRAFT_183443 [Xylaria grammica]
MVPYAPCQSPTSVRGDRAPIDQSFRMACFASLISSRAIRTCPIWSDISSFFFCFQVWPCLVLLRLVTTRSAVATRRRIFCIFSFFCVVRTGNSEGSERVVQRGIRRSWRFVRAARRFARLVGSHEPNFWELYRWSTLALVDLAPARDQATLSQSSVSNSSNPGARNIHPPRTDQQLTTYSWIVDGHRLLSSYLPTQYGVYLYISLGGLVRADGR